MTGERLAPDPIRTTTIPWEWFEHETHGRIIRLWSKTFAQWSLQRPWTGTLHEALDRGATTAEIVDALLAAGHCDGDRDRAVKRVRLYLFMLRDEGYIDLAFDDSPRALPDGATLIKELGRGGVGVAWLVRTGDGDEVVVKHAWDYFQPLSVTDALIRREADVMRHLDHPGVLRLVDTYEADGLLHMVREFVDGPGLVQDVAANARPLGPLVVALADLLSHLHTQGYLLLDSRPSNFLVRPDGTPVLIDVGVCQPWTGGTLRLERTMGSPGYSAPESRRRKEASPASDVYGLGRLLFTLVAARPPLADWGPAEMAPHLPMMSWSDTLLAMCADDPAERPDLDTVRDALRDAGMVGGARSTGEAPKATR